MQQWCCLDALYCAACLQAIVKLPFANVKRLAAAAQQADPNEQELTPADEVSLLIRPTCVFARAAVHLHLGIPVYHLAFHYIDAKRRSLFFPFSFFFSMPFAAYSCMQTLML